MRITIDTDKGIFIVPNTFEKTLEKQNEILKKAKVSEDKLVTPRKFIEDAVKDAFTRPILTTEQAKEWNPAFWRIGWRNSGCKRNARHTAGKGKDVAALSRGR